MENITILQHPLIQHKLTLIRKKDSSSSKVRTILRELATLMAYEVTRDMPLRYELIETPMCAMNAPLLDGKKVVLVSILRAGNGILDGMLQLLPSARVGHIGIYRDPKTLMAIEYYVKMPLEMASRDVIVVDPMLATGHSASAAIHRIKSTKPQSIKFVCLVAAPEGIRELHSEHPGLPIFTAAVDERLDEKGYIIPGLGDAGDRIFGTR